MRKRSQGFGSLSRWLLPANGGWSWSSLPFHLDLEYKDVIVGLDSTGSSLPP